MFCIAKDIVQQETNQLANTIVDPLPTSSFDLLILYLLIEWSVV